MSLASLVHHTEAPPLREDETGAIRIGASRVLLELVIRAFQDGATPEAIAQRYESLLLGDIYAVIAYYLRHRREVEDYLADRAQKGAEALGHSRMHQSDLSTIRARLAAKGDPKAAG